MQNNQPTQIVWMKAVMWNYNMIYIFIIIRHDQSDFQPETEQF